MSQGLLCGDEVRAAVIDLGSYRCRFGSAGQDSPRHIFRTDVGIRNGNEMDDNNNNNSNNNYIIGDSNLRVFNNTIDIDHPYKIIDDNNNDINCKNYDINMNEIEAILNYGLINCMRIDPHEYPLYLAEGPFSSKKQKEELIEIIFETFNSPAMYMSSNAMLSSFCVGKPTSLIVDCGYNETRITPVIDGYALKKSAVVTNRGGRWIDNMIKQEIESNSNIPIMRPWYEVHEKISKNIIPSQSYRNMAINDIIGDLKQHLCFVPWKAINPDERADRMSKLNIPPYELPDGNVIPYYDALSTVPERLYIQRSKKRPRPPPSNDKPSFLQDVDCSVDEDSLSELVHASLLRSDVDTRRDLLSNIILVGGGSNIDGMSQRLGNDLNDLLPDKMKCKVSTPGTTIEKHHATWIGGSILSICGSFQQLWLSNAEYRELGSAIIDQKITH